MVTTIPYREAWARSEALLNALLVYYVAKRPVKLSIQAPFNRGPKSSLKDVNSLSFVGPVER